MRDLVTVRGGLGSFDTGGDDLDRVDLRHHNFSPSRPTRPSNYASLIRLANAKIASAAPDSSTDCAAGADLAE
jgi:hypothetical protein